MVAVLAAVTLVLVLAATKPAVSASPRACSSASRRGTDQASTANETASGEIFDQREMVAAHRCAAARFSVVRVTNLENARRVVLRVIDRGPYGRNYRKGTIIDVSSGAARRLGFVRDGLVSVRVEVVRLGGETGR